ncbi:MAG: DUF2511 domain-containing protein [Alcaligenaceae bacterium]|nr:MAG: DUF2511 domain-containing protein [Alcaligenaceae bacterium]
MPNGVVIEQKLAQSCPAGASQLDASGVQIAPATRPKPVVVPQSGAKTLSGTSLVSRADLGSDWPLTVESGALQCFPLPANRKLQVVTFAAGGNTYALNGTARAQANVSGYRDIRSVWKPNDSIPGTNMPLGVLIDRGLALCS